jgi:NAD(P)-dependent dehydrogenase (short-subunit alcohol dehydrogenase family)
MDLEQIRRSYDFTGKTVVITGGTGVLGGEIACALVGCNAHVVIIDKITKLSDDVVKRIETLSGSYTVIGSDVLDRDVLQKTFDQIIEEFGSIDCLINAAGGNHPDATTGPDKPFFDLPTDAIRFTSDLNLLGTIIPCQIAGKYMAQKGEGIILNVSSMAAMRTLSRVVAYSAAKAGVSNFTRWLAVYMAKEYSTKIRVNAIAPGFFLTKQNKYLLTDEKTGELTERGKTIIDHTPMGRFGDSEDLLGAVLWLLSPESSFVTGIVLPIDGGFAAYGGV